MSVSYTIVTNINDLKDDWNILLEKTKHPEIFYRYEWAECFIQFYLPEKKEQLCIVAGRDSQKGIVCIYPFTYADGTISFITSESTDYNSYYVDNSLNVYHVTEKAIEYLLGERNVEKFCLTNMPSYRELFIIQDVLRKNGFSAFLEESVMAPYMIPGTFDAKGQKKQLKNTERRERNLAKEHEIKYASGSDLKEETLNFIVENRNKRYKESSLKNDNAVQFYQELSIRLGKNSAVNELYLDNKLVAAHFGYRDERKFYYYIPTYLEDYSRSAVGMILLNYIMKENDNIIFDFLKGNEDYKFYWCDDTVMNFHLLAYKKGKDGLLQSMLINLKNNKQIRKIFGR